MTESILIATTRQEGLHPIGTGGQPVMLAFEQLARYLRQHLSEDHAALLAEPNVNPSHGTVDWYAVVPEAGTRVCRYDEADEEVRAAAGETLARLRADIEERAGVLAQSRAGGERVLGRMLNLALEIPGEEYIYCVGDRPVLVCWGNLQDRPQPERGVLRKMVPYRPPPLPAAAAAGVAAFPAAVALRQPFPWLALLLWLLFLLLVVALFVVLLSGCGIGPNWLRDRGLVSFCPLPIARDGGDRSLLEAERIRQDILEEELTRLRFRVAEAQLDCRQQAAAVVPESPPPPAAPLEPDPTPEPEPAAAPEPPPTPEPETPVVWPRPPEREPRTAEEEFDERLEREGGQLGEVTVTLAWNSDSDLDLHIICPDGERIFFDSPSGCGGELDVDMNAVGSNQISLQPVENIVWPNGAPSGDYEVRVDNYRGRSDGTRPVPFSLRIISGDDTHIIEEAIRETDGDRVFYRFTVP